MKFTFPPESRPLEGFTIKRAIYRGGFGEVYYGLTDAGREVALKLIQNNLEVELRGVQQCLNLSHPNLVTIFDVREDGDGDHWIVMEYVAGETLEAAIRRHPEGMPLEMVRKWLPGLAAGVDYLHSRGIVHRDLKPGNLFLENGVVKICDVGLSKFIAPSRRSAQTQSVGTVYYMAPEVAKGRYGREVDIYACGIILYEMLTGQVPFEGESTGEILMKHLTEQPDLARLPPRLQSVIGKSLRKDPEQRYHSIEELHQAFDAACLGKSVRPAPEMADTRAAPGRVNLPDRSRSEVTAGEIEQHLRHRDAALLESVGIFVLLALVVTILAGLTRVGWDVLLSGLVLSGGAAFAWYRNQTQVIRQALRRGPDESSKSSGDRANAARVLHSSLRRRALSSSFALYLLLLGASTAVLWITDVESDDDIGIFAWSAAVAFSGIVAVAIYVRQISGERPGASMLAPPIRGQAGSSSQAEGLAHRQRRRQRPATLSRRLHASLASAALIVPCTLVLTFILGLLKPSLFDGRGLSDIAWNQVGFFTSVAITAGWLIAAVPSVVRMTGRRWMPVRWCFALAGVIQGLFAGFLADWLLVTVPARGEFSSHGLFRHLGDQALISDGSPTTAGYVAFFVVLFWFAGWAKMMRPDRRARFRIGAVISTLFITWMATLFLAFPLAWALSWAAVLACAVQLASPWDDVVAADHRRCPSTSVHGSRKTWS